MPKPPTANHHSFNPDMSFCQGDRPITVSAKAHAEPTLFSAEFVKCCSERPVCKHWYKLRSDGTKCNHPLFQKTDPCYLPVPHTLKFSHTAAHSTSHNFKSIYLSNLISSDIHRQHPHDN